MSRRRSGAPGGGCPVGRALGPVPAAAGPRRHGLRPRPISLDRGADQHLSPLATEVEVVNVPFRALDTRGAPTAGRMQAAPGLAPIARAPEYTRYRETLAAGSRSRTSLIPYPTHSGVACRGIPRWSSSAEGSSGLRRRPRCFVSAGARSSCSRRRIASRRTRPATTAASSTPACTIEPGSLKARLSVEGREALYAFCHERGIPTSAAASSSSPPDRTSSRDSPSWSAGARPTAYGAFGAAGPMRCASASRTPPASPHSSCPRRASSTTRRWPSACGRAMRSRGARSGPAPGSRRARDGAVALVVADRRGVRSGLQALVNCAGLASRPRCAPLRRGPGTCASSPSAASTTAEAGPARPGARPHLSRARSCVCRFSGFISPAPFRVPWRRGPTRFSRSPRRLPMEPNLRGRLRGDGRESAFLADVTASLALGAGRAAPLPEQARLRSVSPGAGARRSDRRPDARRCRCASPGGGPGRQAARRFPFHGRAGHAPCPQRPFARRDGGAGHRPGHRRSSGGA